MKPAPGISILKPVNAIDIKQKKYEKQNLGSGSTSILPSDISSAFHYAFTIVN
tara:strand:+ start:142 stop:300 length:159 start_codon:yes stop_codon:yes gene_type:complete